MNIDQIIKAKLAAASLSESELALWETTLGHLNEEMRGDILAALDAKPDGVRILTDSLVLKTQALSSGDVTQWEQALASDVAIINKK